MRPGTKKVYYALLLFLCAWFCARFLLPLLVTLLGGILVLLPMTASRLVFSLCGLAVTVIGVFMLLDRLRLRRLNGGDEDPNIIDAL